jgi:glycosyltransferase involved in cell wall biosynthesis
VAVGRSPEGLDGIPFIHVPFTSNEKALSRVYAASDLYVTPSLEDNLPNTVLESLACGTPVAAFRTGGIPEMVKHQTNGWICETPDAKSLQKGLEHMLFSADLASMSMRAVETVKSNFSEVAVATQYIALYQQALK